MMFYTHFKRDALACFECSSSDPGVMQRLEAVLLVLVLVGKYSFMTNNDSPSVSRRPESFSTRQHSPVLVLSSVDEGLNPINRDLRSLWGSVPREWILHARQFPESRSWLWNTVPGPSVDSSGSPPPFPWRPCPATCLHHCLLCCRWSHRPRLPLG